jgi:hypothetical protein
VSTRFATIVIALVAVLAGVTLFLLPPAALPPAPSTVPLTWPVVRGAYHVQSQRSDGTGTLDEIAAAAAKAGLQFVIVTDHGDATRVPDPPTYRAGVLCLDAVEISTDHGHYVAIDLPQTPYPLGGHVRDVIEDVRRFGGFGIAAHPGSPKAALQWRDWDASLDGIEWLNADSEWRDELWASLGAVLLTYAFRPVETLGGLLDRPSDVIAQWDRLVPRRRVAALAGADAHARLGFREAADPYEDRVIARVPSYEVSFRAFANHVILDASLTGDAAADASLISSAIREGRVFTSIDSLAGLSRFEMKALSGGAVARPGEYLDIVAPVAIEAAIAAPAGTTLTVLRDGELVYETREPALRIDVGTEPGAYRVEAQLPSQRGRLAVPWVLTNPIYIGLREAHARAAIEPPTAEASSRASIATESWQAEASAGSTSALRPIQLEDGTPAIEWAFSLADGPRGAQYAALRFPVNTGLAAHDRLRLRVRSDQPRRLWAQLRAPGSQEGERWGRSFVVGVELESLELRFDEFRPLGAVSSTRAPLDRVDSLLLVVDTVNTAPGSSGRIAMTDLWLAR